MISGQKKLVNSLNPIPKTACLKLPILSVSYLSAVVGLDFTLIANFLCCHFLNVESLKARVNCQQETNVE